MNQIGVVRAEWLTQIAAAIDSAQRLAWQLRTQEGASNEARDLYNRLEAARAELESLSHGTGRPAAVSDSDWLRVLGWTGSLTERDD